MATWVLGDVQGCFGAFRRLLRQIEFQQTRDRLWFVGDLVNRGPDSLGMLRWVRDHEDSVTVVLGNHDLHLLALDAGVRKLQGGDTLLPVLEAPDGAALCDWLSVRPFSHHEGRFAMVHAGIPPGWSLKKAEKRALRAGKKLREDRRRFLKDLYRLRSGKDAASRGVAAASLLTRLRAVDSAGAPLFGFDGPPEELPSGARPWFDGLPPPGPTILFGHWAALGLPVTDRAICLDSGCVWGGSLTAMRLEDGALAIQPALPEESVSVFSRS